MKIHPAQHATFIVANMVANNIVTNNQCSADFYPANLDHPLTKIRTSLSVKINDSIFSKAQAVNTP